MRISLITLLRASYARSEQLKHYKSILYFIFRIQNCDYFVSSQLLSLVMVDMAMTIVGALLPFVMFKVNDYLESRKNKKVAKFNYSFFESIDNFYE